MRLVFTRTRHAQLASRAVLLLALMGCGRSEYHVEVRVAHPGYSALANLQVTALPFNRDAVRDSLATTFALARPQFPELEAEMARYERPDLSGFQESLTPWLAIYDSVRNLADSLNAITANGSTEYAAAYARLRAQYQRLARASVERDEAISDLVGEDRDLGMRVARAADSMRAWEGRALASFPELADSILARDGRMVRFATTGTDGVAEFDLEPGRWWFVARSPDPRNPFREHYWNVGARIGLFGSKSIPLYDGNGESRWRY